MAYGSSCSLNSSDGSAPASGGGERGEQGLDGGGGEFDQFLAEGIFDADFVPFDFADNESDVLVGVVRGDAGVRGELAELVPALEIVGGVVVQGGISFLRILADQPGGGDEPEGILHGGDEPLFFLEVGVRVIDLVPRDARKLPVHPLFEVRDERQAPPAADDVRKVLHGAGFKLAETLAGEDQQPLGLGPGNQQDAIAQPLMPVVEAVVRRGGVVREHQDLRADRFRGGDDVFDLPAAVVRQEGVDVKIGPVLAERAGAGDFDSLRLQGFDRLVHGGETFRGEAVESVLGSCAGDGNQRKNGDQEQT